LSYVISVVLIRTMVGSGSAVGIGEPKALGLQFYQILPFLLLVPLEFELTIKNVEDRSLKL